MQRPNTASIKYALKLFAANVSAYVMDCNLSGAVERRQTRVFWHGQWRTAIEIVEYFDRMRQIDGLPEYAWPQYNAAIDARINELFHTLPEEET